MLVDVDGDERIDLLFNHTALIHGHGYGPVAEAVARKSRQFEAVPFPGQHETALARLLTSRVPADDALFRFTSSGSEAVMLALLATAATGRRKIVVFEHCYHGAFVAASPAEALSQDCLLCLLTHLTCCGTYLRTTARRSRPCLSTCARSGARCPRPPPRSPIRSGRDARYGDAADRR